MAFTIKELESLSGIKAHTIRIWEQRHQIDLPRNPEHQLIGVIADATALTRAQVLEEQRMRAEVRAAKQARS